MDRTVYIPHLPTTLDHTFKLSHLLNNWIELSALEKITVTLLLIKLPTYHRTHVSLQCSQKPAMSEALSNISYHASFLQ